MELCLSSYACRFVLVELCFIKMKDSTPMLARFRICEVVRVVLVELCFAKSERQYNDFGKLYDLHGLCTLCLSCLSSGACQK